MVILSGLLLGIGFGYLVRRRERVVVASGRIMGWSVYLLLFLLGVSVGGNEVLLRSLPELGKQALLLSLAAVAGSIVGLGLLANWLDIAHEK